MIDDSSINHSDSFTASDPDNYGRVFNPSFKMKKNLNNAARSISVIEKEIYQMKHQILPAKSAIVPPNSASKANIICFNKNEKVLTNLKVDNQILSEELEISRSKNKKMKNEIHYLSSNLNKFTSLQRQTHETIENYKKNAKSMLKKVGIVKNENKILKNQIEELTKRVQILQGKVKELKAENQKVELFNHETLAQYAINYENEINDLKTQLEAKELQNKREIKKMQKKFNNMEKEKEKLVDELDKTNKERIEIGLKMKNNQNYIDNLKSENIQIEKAKEEANQENIDSNFSIVELTEENTKLKEQIQFYMRDGLKNEQIVKSLNNKISNLENELVQVRSQSTKYQLELNEAQQKATQLEFEYEETNAKNLSMDTKSLFPNSPTKPRNLSQIIENFKAQISILQKEKEQLITKQYILESSKNAEIGKLKAQILETEMQMKRVQQENQVLKISEISNNKQVDSLKTQIILLQQNNTNQQEKYKNKFEFENNKRKMIAKCFADTVRMLDQKIDNHLITMNQKLDEQENKLEDMSLKVKKMARKRK